MFVTMCALYLALTGLSLTFFLPKKVFLNDTVVRFFLLGFSIIPSLVAAVIIVLKTLILMWSVTSGEGCADPEYFHQWFLGAVTVFLGMEVLAQVSKKNPIL